VARGEVFTVPVVELAAWLPELVLGAAVLLSLALGAGRTVRATRPALLVGLVAAAVLAVWNWPRGVVQPWGPHWTVDETAGLVRLAVLVATALLVLNLPRGSGRGGAMLGVAALGVIWLAQAATIGALMLAVAAFVAGASLSAWLLAPAGGRPAIRRWHGTATVGFALAAAGAVLWSGLAGTLDLARTLDSVAMRPLLPPLVLPLVLGSLGAGLALALLGEPGRFASGTGEESADAPTELPAAMTGWLTAVPPLGLIALLLRLLQATPPARPLSALPDLMTGAAAVLVLGGMLVALVQRSLVRRLAWAATGQVGLALCGLAAPLPAAGAAAAHPALSLLLLFAAAQLGACLLVEIVSTLDARRRRRQLLPLLMAGVLLALAALPPLAGWRPRVLMLQALLGGERYAAAGLVLAGTLLGCFVYLRPLVDLWRQDEADAAGGPRSASGADGEPVWPVVALLSAAALLAVLLAWGLGLLELSVWLPLRAA
jgi:NADH-quinone oxidoreductase subunit N